MDLDEWLGRRRHWAELTELLDQMPNGCRWRAAQAHDRQLAEEILAQYGEDAARPPEPSPPRFDGWTGERQDLADIKDLLLALIAATCRSERSPSTVDRPMPAIDELLQERSSSKLNDLVSTLLGVEH